MSGGSYNYIYRHVDEFADCLEAKKDWFDGAVNDEEINHHLRGAFAKHLKKVADAMKAIEWVDSGDCSPGHEVEAIEMVLNQKQEASE